MLPMDEQIRINFINKKEFVVYGAYVYGAYVSLAAVIGKELLELW